MATLPTLMEFRIQWMPYATERGLTRVIELLETASPLLIHGAFSRCVGQGCLATHLAWHHPKTARLQADAGVVWLTRIAKMNPATSAVLLEWDRCGVHNWILRDELIAECRDELQRRAERKSTESYEEDFCMA